MQVMPSKQRGMSLIGMLMVIILIISFALLGIKIVPLYLQNHTVKKVIDGLNDEPGITKMSPRRIRQLTMKRMNVNSVYHFKEDYLSVSKGRKYITVIADYEVRENIVGNLDVMLTFHEKTEIPLR